MADLGSQVRRNLDDFADRVADEEEEFRWQSEKVDLISQTIARLNLLGGSLADVGCFTGKATLRYRSRGFLKTVGFDSSEPALAKAATRGIETRRWIVGVDDRCPAGDDEFSVVVAADIIEHIVDTDAFAGELYRIVEPAGFVIVTTPNLAFWLSRLRLLAGQSPWSHPGVSSTVREDVNIDLNHIRLGTVREWQALYRSAGFAVRDVKGWSILHAYTGGLGIRVRRLIDRRLTKYPDLAFGLLFLLQKSPT
jgi:SAM-dependent methyltransferase